MEKAKSGATESAYDSGTIPSSRYGLLKVPEAQKKKKKMSVYAMIP